MEVINTGVATLFRNYTNALLEKLCEEYDLPVDEVKSKYMDGVVKKKAAGGGSKKKKDVVKCCGHTKKGDPCKRNALFDGMCKKHFEERDEHADEEDEVDQYAKVSEMIETIEGEGSAEHVPVSEPVKESKGKGKAKDVAESSKAPKKTKKTARAPTPEFSDELPVMPKIKITKRKKSTAPVPKYKGPALEMDSMSGVYTSSEVGGVETEDVACSSRENDAEIDAEIDGMFDDEPEASIA